MLCITNPNRGCVVRSVIFNHGGFDTPPINGNPVQADDFQNNPFEYRIEAEYDHVDEGAQEPQVQVDYHRILQNYCRRAVVDVYHGQSKKHIIYDFNRTMDIFGVLFPFELQSIIPKSFEGIKAMAKLPSHRYTRFDVCTNTICGTPFPNPPPKKRKRRHNEDVAAEEPPIEDVCHNCQEPRFHGKRVDHGIIVFDLEDHVKNMFSTKKIVQQLEYCLKPNEHDVWSSKKLRNVSIQDRKNKIYVTLCCDKTDFFKDSWTPMVLRILNYSPEVRVHKDAMITLAGTTSYHYVSTCTMK